MDVSEFFFFCSGAGEKEKASEEVAGGSVLTKTRGRGVLEEEAWEGEGRWGNGGGGGGLNIFFRGRNSHQEKFASEPLELFRSCSRIPPCRVYGSSLS